MKPRKVLKEDALKAFAERQKALAKVITDNLAEKEKQVELKRAARQAIEQAQTLIAKAEAEIADANLVIRNMQDGITLAEAENEEINADLANHEYNAKFNAMMSEQSDFWAAATIRLQKIQEELKEELPDFANFLDPAQAMENLRKQTEGSPFTQYSVDVRTVAGNYQRLLEDLVSDKLDGKSIRLSRHQERNNLLDRFLKSETIERSWNKG